MTAGNERSQNFACTQVLVADHSFLLQLIELFKLADKYDCPGLSAECVSMLGKVTWVHDVAPLLQVRSRSGHPCTVHA